MADEKDEPPSSPVELVVRRLADEAKITEDQAREPIAILGLNWASLGTGSTHSVRPTRLDRLPHNPFQQLGINVISAGIVGDQTRGLGPPLVFRNVRFDDVSYEGTANDIAVERRYLITWLIHGATSHPREGNRMVTWGFNNAFKAAFNRIRLYIFDQSPRAC